MIKLLTIFSSLGLVVGTNSLPVASFINQTREIQTEGINLSGKAVSKKIQGWVNDNKETDEKDYVKINSESIMGSEIVIENINMKTYWWASKIGDQARYDVSKEVRIKVNELNETWKEFEYFDKGSAPNGYGFSTSAYVDARNNNGIIEIKLRLNLSAGSWWVWPIYNESVSEGSFTWNGDYHISWGK